MRHSIAAVFALVLSVAACSDPLTGPDAGSYVLVAVDGAPLPAELKPTFVDRLFAISGTLTIGADKTYQYTIMRGGLNDPKGNPLSENGTFTSTSTSMTLTPASYYTLPSGGSGGDPMRAATFTRGGNLDIVEQARESPYKHTYSFKRTS